MYPQFQDTQSVAATMFILIMRAMLLKKKVTNYNNNLFLQLFHFMLDRRLFLTLIAGF